MKRIVSLSLICSFLLHAGAALSQTSLNTGILFKVVDARQWRGAKFKVQAAVRARILEPSAHACIWVRVDDEDKMLAFYDNMHNHPIRTDKWTVYTSAE